MNTSKPLINIGNCSNIIDWSELITEIEQQPSPAYVGPRQSLDDPEVQEIAQKWRIGGYKSVPAGGTAEWHMFFPDTHFDKKYLNLFLEYCGITQYNSAWVSRIMPGYCAPTHRDLQIADTENPTRIHCHMDTPEVGHVLIVADTYLYNQPQGEIYKWTDPMEWHSSFNLGLKPSYIFNIY